MAKNTTPSFVVTRRIMTDDRGYDKLNKIMRITERMYNAGVRHGNSWENRCSFLDGDQCICDFHYYLCGTEFRSRQISPYAKKCECLHDHEYGQFCGADHFDVFICSLDLSSVYHRQRSDRPWCAYESFFTAVLFYLCDNRNFVRGTERYRKGSGAYAPYLRWCVFFENPVAFYCRTDVSGNQYDHAQLSGFMEHYGSIVYCILFYEISRKEKGGLTIFRYTIFHEIMQFILCLLPKSAR